MSTRNWQMRIEDILEALDRIDDYCSGLNFENWKNDRKKTDAVIRNLDNNSCVLSLSPSLR